MRGTVTGMMPPALFFSLVIWMVLPAAAEPFLDLYAGKNFTHSSDITVEQPTLRNDYTFKDVSFEDKSFETPPWYGMRVGYYFESYPWLGTAIEFFHFKMVADTSENKRLMGTRDGTVVDTTARVNSSIQQFQITHGVNYLTLDALVRYRLLEDREQFRKGRVQLYGGLGVGPVIAHAENVVGNVGNREGYEIGGVGIQAFVGARALPFKYLGLFAEYKFTHSGHEIGIAAGVGRVGENTHHLVGGVTIPPHLFRLATTPALHCFCSQRRTRPVFSEPERGVPYGRNLLFHFRCDDILFLFRLDRKEEVQDCRISRRLPGPQIDCPISGTWAISWHYSPCCLYSCFTQTIP